MLFARLLGERDVGWLFPKRDIGYASSVDL